MGLESLRGLLEAVDTFPFVKYIASVGIQIIQIVIVRGRVPILFYPHISSGCSSQ